MANDTFSSLQPLQCPCWMSGCNLDWNPLSKDMAALVLRRKAFRNLVVEVGDIMFFISGRSHIYPQDT